MNHHHHQNNCKVSNTEFADVDFDEDDPISSHLILSSLNFPQRTTTVSATVVLANANCPQPQLHVPLSPKVRQKLNTICEEKEQLQPDAELRRKLGLLGEEKALELLGEIYNTKTKIITLSGYIGFMHQPSRTLSEPVMVALQYLESLCNAHLELAKWYNTLADLYQRKLWHQLTLKLEQFVTLVVFQKCQCLLACLPHLEISLLGTMYIYRLEMQEFGLGMMVSGGRDAEEVQDGVVYRRSSRRRSVMEMELRFVTTRPANSVISKLGRWTS